jgi:hypothetical protein
MLSLSLAQDDITKVRPGLSGIGSVVFRSEEDMMHANAEPDRLYDDVIMPLQGQVGELVCSE